MCKGIGIRYSAHNIDTPIISALYKLNSILNNYYMYTHTSILDTYK